MPRRSIWKGSFVDAFLLRMKKNFVTISIPLLLLLLGYFICLLLGSIDLFYVLFLRIGSALGSRALSLALCQMGCSGGLALAIGLAVRVFFGDVTLFMDEAGPSSGGYSNPGNPVLPPVDPKVNEVSQDDIWEAVDAEEARKEKELMLSKEWKELENLLYRLRQENLHRLEQNAKLLQKYEAGLRRLEYDLEIIKARDAQRDEAARLKKEELEKLEIEFVQLFWKDVSED